MRIPSSKTFVLLAFALGLASVVLSTIIRSSIETRRRTVDSEYRRLDEAQDDQVDRLMDTEQRFTVYRIMHYLAFTSPKEKTDEAKWDATQMLEQYLIRFYAAANGISPVDVIRTELEEDEGGRRENEKVLNLEVMIQKSNDPSERARLTSEVDRILKEEPPPKSELARKMREFGKYSEAELTARNGPELFSALLPPLRSSLDQLAESIKKTDTWMRELESQRSSLTWKADYTTYAAVSLQIFSLMLILSKDLAKDLRERRGGSVVKKDVVDDAQKQKGSDQ